MSIYVYRNVPKWPTFPAKFSNSTNSTSPCARILHVHYTASWTRLTKAHDRQPVVDMAARAGSTPPLRRRACRSQCLASKTAKQRETRLSRCRRPNAQKVGQHSFTCSLFWQYLQEDNCIFLWVGSLPLTNNADIMLVKLHKTLPLSYC